ncbi:hypothetical protein I5M27_11995 [Adhaeribacter sp. BT258]|uniref:Uncharacterized protein n=1 Tax=Adhaeribacter terrigena TaxID=2793070 RepID=A0ABS1C2X1_9BACT|nr:hypothetical protein [Adhaeribacter terrigena]MBK0403712.1 hypothetical protein [Adhaeribacter terrigena]
MSLRRKGILSSYLIGTPLGLITIFLFFSIPAMLTGEGLATMSLFAVYGKAVVGLIISFLIALGLAGYSAAVDLENQKTLLKSSFKFSLIVNSIIWSVFILLTILDNDGKNFWLYLIPPIIAFLVCTAITTFTIGLLICNSIKQKINNLN